MPEKPPESQFPGAEYEIDLPGPYPELSPNKRSPWPVKAQATRLARRDAFLATKALGIVWHLLSVRYV